MASPLTSGDLERVIQRAAELHFEETGAPSEALGEEEILKIGRQVGLPTPHLRRALAEARAERMLPPPPPDPLMVRRLLGSGGVRVGRVVPGEASGVREHLEAHFRERESLVEIRRRQGFSIWEPAGGIKAHVQRALDWEGRGYPLVRAGRVELTVSGLEEGWSLVAVAADLRKVRRDHALAWSLSLLAGTAPLATFVALATPVPAGAALSVGFAGALMASAWGARATLAGQRDRLRLALEGLLDRLEAGEALDPIRDRTSR